MRHIDNIEIHSFSANLNIMNIGANKQFQKQRNNYPEYDQFLIELAEFLKNDASDKLKHVYNTLIYIGGAMDIIRDVMPKINCYYNNQLTAKEVYEKLKE